MSRLIRRLVLLPIRGYQRAISPALPRRCKYHPTCSAYAVQAIESYGILRGAVLAVWRLLRCNPFSHGGYDPVSAQKVSSRRPSPRTSDSSLSRKPGPPLS
jgi:putative membrane protein insertion efficiency factor